MHRSDRGYEEDTIILKIRRIKWGKSEWQDGNDERRNLEISKLIFNFWKKYP